MAKANNYRKTITFPSADGSLSCRVLYPALLEPKAGRVNGVPTAPKYGVSLLIKAEDTKTTAFKELSSAVMTAAKDSFPNTDFSKGWPWQLGYTCCLRPYDTFDKPPAGMEPGDYLLKAATGASNKPGVVGGNLKPITDPSKLYGGMYGVAQITISGYDNGGKGVTAYLNNFMKVKDGAPLGGTNAPADTVFAPAACAAEEDATGNPFSGSMNDDDIPF